MELLYVWIKDFKPFVNFPVNCSNKYTFNYEHESKKLFIDINPTPLPEDFFGKRILNINPILGNNGAGKTRFFSYLCSFFGNYYVEFIVVLKIKNKIRIFHHQNIEFNLVIKDNGNLKDVNEIIKIKPETIRQNDDPLFKIIEKRLAKIYVNHNIQLNKQFPGTNLFDRSTTGLLNSASERKKTQHGGYSTFIEEEMLRNLNLIKRRGELISKLFHVKSKSVGIYFDSSLSLQTKSRQYTNYLSQNPAIRHAISQVKGRKKLSENYFSFDNLNLKATFLGLAILQFLGKPIDDFPNNTNNLKVVNNYISKSISDLQVTPKNNYFKLLFNFIKSRQHSKNIQLQINLGPESNHSFPIIDFVTIQYEISFASAPLFFNMYFKSLELAKLVSNNPADIDSNFHFLGFNWHISTGQYAYLSLLSRILMEKTKLNKFPSIWIILDEVDQVFHPQWEKEFLTNFLEFLRLEFEGNRIQLFIGSHNPIILSDIPHTNATLIKVDDPLPPINVSKINEINTFGGNIHSLYKNSFFLVQGFIGKFAETKIDEVIKFLNKKLDSRSKDPVREMSLEYVFNLINIIGEPIVKQMLLELFFKAFENENKLQELEKKKKEIEIEIKQLNKTKRK